MAILFKDQPFELWDLRSLTLLRTMPDNFPTVTALEWSPLASSKRAHWAGRRGVEPIFPETKAMPTAPTASVREQLVFTDADAQLYYFTVEGNVVRDCTRNPPEVGWGELMGNRCNGATYRLAQPVSAALPGRVTTSCLEMLMEL